jgi:hypothetical protein
MTTVGVVNRPLYYIVKYHASGDTLTVWQMDGDHLATAIEKGSLKGFVSKLYLGKVACLTDNPENLTKYVADANDAKLFPAALRVIYKRQAHTGLR